MPSCPARRCCLEHVDPPDRQLAARHRPFGPSPGLPLLSPAQVMRSSSRRHSRHHPRDGPKYPSFGRCPGQDAIPAKDRLGLHLTTPGAVPGLRGAGVRGTDSRRGRERAGIRLGAEHRWGRWLSAIIVGLDVSTPSASSRFYDESSNRSTPRRRGLSGCRPRAARPQVGRGFYRYDKVPSTV